MHYVPRNTLKGTLPTSLTQAWARGTPRHTTVHSTGSSVYAISLHSSRLLAGCKDTRIRLYDLSTASDPLIIDNTTHGHTASVLCIAERGDGTWASGSSDTRILVWSGTSPQHGNHVLLYIKLVYTGHTDSVLGLAWLSDGRLVSASKDTTLLIHPAGTILGRHQAAVNSIASHKSIVVSASGDRSVMAWVCDSEGESWEVGRHDRGVACVAFDGDVVVSGSSDACICVW